MLKLPTAIYYRKCNRSSDPKRLKVTFIEQVDSVVKTCYVCTGHIHGNTSIDELDQGKLRSGSLLAGHCD